MSESTDERPIGERIREFREASGMSQEGVGLALGLSRQEVSHLETGYRQNTSGAVVILLALYQSGSLHPRDVLGQW